MDNNADPTDIQLTAVVSDGQTVRVNKYFANAFTVDWGDGSPEEGLTADIIKMYAT
jgi:hypothetical protein